MFSGIIESVQPIISAISLSGLVRIEIKKPQEFNDLKIGDSIAVDGICLTLESFDLEKMVFAMAAETLLVLGLKDTQGLYKKMMNLERSLKFGDRIHGHLVTGHVDSLAEVTRAEALGESWLMDVKVKASVRPFIWKKGSITLNGVSLTVNNLENDIVSVCLIPETMKRTNLGGLKTGDMVNVEADYFAKALVIQAKSIEGKDLEL